MIVIKFVIWRSSYDRQSLKIEEKELLSQTVEIESIDELLNLIDQGGVQIIISPKNNNGEYYIEIDDFFEDK